MGNTIADFKEGRIERYRDRHEIKTNGPNFGDYWFRDKPVKPRVNYAWGSVGRCVDQSHPGFYRMLRTRSDPRFKNLRDLDIGGPLMIEKTSLSAPKYVDAKEDFFGTPRGYLGYLFPSTPYKGYMQNAGNGKPSFPVTPISLGIDRGSLRALGSTAIAKSIPDIPDFSLFRFVGELKAGLPKIPLKALLKEKKLRSVGDEYLNYQFGIAPTLGDLQKFIELIANPALRSAVKHTLDEEHRVRKTLDKGSTSSIRSMTSSEYTSFETSAGQAGTIKTIESYKIWSSISFVYHQASMLDQLLADFDEKMGGFGIVPNAIDLWNLTAWSWLVDWFVNFNHVITSLSYLGKNGLYMQRGYLMASYSTREEHFQTGRYLGGAYSTLGVVEHERKYRIAASPFGFGYTWKEFDPFQLSILGALGVSRLKF
jgi:hypothetical protein